MSVMIQPRSLSHRKQAGRDSSHNHESEPTTEVAIRRAPAEDLYITLGNYDLAEGNVTLKVVVNPVVDWIWFGFMLLAIGTGVALIPESVMERLTTWPVSKASWPAPSRRVSAPNRSRRRSCWIEKASRAAEIRRA